MDLDYPEDVDAHVDMNVAMLANNSFVEVQGTGEHATFTPKELNAMLKLAVGGSNNLHQLQSQALKIAKTNPHSRIPHLQKVTPP